MLLQMALFCSFLWLSNSFFFNLRIRVSDEDKDDVSSRHKDMKLTEMHFLVHTDFLVMQGAGVTEPNFTCAVKPIYRHQVVVKENAAFIVKALIQGK